MTIAGIKCDKLQMKLIFSFAYETTKASNKICTLYAKAVKTQS